MGEKLNKHSAEYTQVDSQSGSQSMLYGIGLTDEDMNKAQVGIASTWYDGNTCNMHLLDLATLVRDGARASGLVGLRFNTIGVSDGISMGTDGMNYSLQSRDIIADSIETVMMAQKYDANISVVGCDKNMPGALMAIGRVNRSALMLYGGTIAPGWLRQEKLDIVSGFEAYGKFLVGEISEEELKEIYRHACPGAGACGGMYTANTMASAIETLGMSLPYSSSTPAMKESGSKEIHPEKANECLRAGEAIRNLLEQDIKPRDIMTREAFENAMTIVMALGGSTNAVLHLIAMAKSVEVPLSVDDFQRISDKTPYLADLKPSGSQVMEDLHYVGGIPAVQKMLLEADMLHGDCMTVTGRTLEENLQEVPGFNKGQTVIRSLDNPIKKDGHIQILYGNLAPDSAVAKVTGKEGTRFEGTARVYDAEEEMIAALEQKKIQPGDVAVIRYEGPRGGPGMSEMLKCTGAIMGAGLGKDIALITDGRFSGGTHGFTVGHITPEAQDGGLIAFVEDGDHIIIDAEDNTLTLDVPDGVLAERRANWKAPPLKAKRGTLRKYIESVKPAHQGCVTDEFD